MCIYLFLTFLINFLFLKILTKKNPKKSLFGQNFSFLDQKCKGGTILKSIFSPLYRIDKSIRKIYALIILQAEIVRELTFYSPC